MQGYVENTWEYVPEFPDYVINHHAEIVNIKHDRPISTSVNQQGIVKVNLYKDGVAHTRSLAPLMARTFLSHPNPLYNTPIHMDGDKTNCHISNLQLRPRWYAYEYHLQFSNEYFQTGLKKPVYIVGTDDKFDNIREASIALGLWFLHIEESVYNGNAVYPGNLQFRFDSEPK